MNQTITAGAWHSPRLVVVESETRVLAGLRRAFGRAGFDVLAAQSVPRAVELLRISPDVMVFDTALLTRDLADLRSALRRQTERPAVLVTGRDSEEVTYFASEFGAARHLVKPYGLGDIVAAARACLSEAQRPRTHNHRHLPGEPARAKPRVLMTIDAATRSAAVDGRWVTLTPPEYTVLTSLLAAPGKVCPRPSLLTDAEVDRGSADRHRLEYTVAALRVKMGTAELIETVRGVGYRFNVNLCEVRSLPASGVRGQPSPFVGAAVGG